MPSYDLRCKNCEDTFEITCNYRTLSGYYLDLYRCSECGSKGFKQVILTPRAGSISAKFSADGKARNLGGSVGPEQGTKVMNIWDHHADGSSTCTRIGPKKMLDHE